MSQETPTPQGPTDHDAADFGPNQWLVDAMREEWRADPSSVDESWATFFASESDGSGTSPAPDASAPEGSAEQSAQSAPAEQSAPAQPAADGPTESKESIAEQRARTEPPTTTAPINAVREQRAADAKSAEPKSGSGRRGGARSEQSASAAAGSERGRKAPTASDRPRPKAPPAPVVPEHEPIEPRRSKLRGPAAAIAKNMDESLTVPTATTVRSLPAKLMFDNRIVINNHLRRKRGGKISFTHLIGWAMIESLQDVPAMNNGYETGDDGKPYLLEREDLNFGLAIDLPRPDGSRTLVVPNIKGAQTLDFKQFVDAYEDLVKRARDNKLTVSDYADTTVSLTNPGGIGTTHSVPRLSKGQGTIVGVGAMNYPAEFQGASTDTIARLAVSRILTLTSTYDHRVIQGAASGEFLQAIEQKLLGLDGFYDRIFSTLRLPYEPIRWVVDNPLGDDETTKFSHVKDLIHSFRVRGHLMADIDPLEYKVRSHPDLDVETYGLTLWDLDRRFTVTDLGGVEGARTMKLREILSQLRDAYSRTIGVEYMHIADREERLWLQQKIEAPSDPMTSDEVRLVLEDLNSAEAFETFLQTKFVGQKRFSLEGGESLIPMLGAILEDASDVGIEEVGIGMAHRGRLNVLSNIAGKSYRQIFREFSGLGQEQVTGSGDVKYHLGTEGTYTARDGATTKVYLAANPSHLEAVNPVLEGIVRAKQDHMNLGGAAFPVLPILIHGDASMAGQGVVAETLNLSELPGYRTGGTVHIVVNNQIGFTTAPSSSRSSFYATDVSKIAQLPVFHVNGEDPEAVVRVARLALEYRQKFQRDVVIDMVCYRKRGHNEGDDPSMTQPLMYDIIEKKASVRSLYTESLTARGLLTPEETEQVVEDFHARLEKVFEESRLADHDERAEAEEANRERISGRAPDDPEQEPAGGLGRSRTAVDPEVLERIGDAMVDIPDSFHAHPKVMRVMKRRQKMSREGDIDWSFAELAALGSLALEGTPIRMSGQDTRRGTFTQRHSVLFDTEDAASWTPLLHLSEDQARFSIHDSSLSEFAALGFEYGYSVEASDALTLWEAQYGDFFNGAQVVIDEFVSAAEQKWNQRSGLVMLLPHGYEGSGPDHSSARLERFLQMCAEENLRVAFPTTPASYFHLLRLQAKTRPQRPLIVMTPKSMLRHKEAISSIEDFTSGTFQPVIGDPSVDPSQVDRVLLCSGKVYWDLVAERNKREDTSTAVVRVELLYPLHQKQLHAALDPFGDADLVWVQEEPQNQGAWPFMADAMAREHGRRLQVVARTASASPATGSAARHAEQQKELIARALDR